jgi:hypothetical protein
MNVDCMWPAEVPSGLDVRNLWDKQHLLEDIRIAEELDIRHRDSVLGRKVTSVFGIVVRMGGQRPPSVSPIAHSECAGLLFDRLANTHRISLQDVLAARQQLPARGANIPVTVPVMLLYAWLARCGIRWIRMRVDPVERWQMLLAVLYASIAIFTKAIPRKD